MAKGVGQLSYDEREMIAKLRFDGFGISGIAVILGRSKSTISEELNRNSRNGRYNPVIAEALARRRKSRPRVMDKMDYLKIREYVENGLKKQWSPEQISGRMKVDFPCCKRHRISHERIYQWIWTDKHNGGLWYKELRYGRKPRRHRCRCGARRRIKNRIGIEERPLSVDMQYYVGDWEGDTIWGSTGKGLFASWLKRKTGYCCLAAMFNKSSASLNHAIMARFERDPWLPIRTVTLDNGTEFSGHETLSKRWSAGLFCSSV